MKGPPAWRVLEVHAASADEELVVTALDDAGARGSWTVEPGVVRGYFGSAGEPPEAAFRSAWGALAPGIALPTLSVTEIAAEDWSAAWKAGARAVAVTGRLWVAPPDAEPAGLEWPGGVVVIRIQPGAGFGTGGHATTRALLTWLDAERSDAPVLDVGTGSGVLAIAAVRLGARRAVGLDVDVHALDNAAENRVRNGVQDRVALVAGSVDALRPGARFSRVLANLDAGTFERRLPELVARCAPGGRLGVAGLLAGEREGFLARAAAYGLELEEERSEADLSLGDVWWSGRLRAGAGAGGPGPGRA